MNTLIIDTSSRQEIISIKANNKIYEISKDVKLSHSITLFNNLQICLEKTKKTMQDIELIGVGIGPGSFTGVRISVTTARMMAQLLQIPLIGIKTHLLFASSVECNINSNILIAFDAKKNRVFGALYKKTENENQLKEIVEPGDYMIEYLLGKIDKNETHAIGDGIEKYLKEIEENINILNYINNFKFNGRNACEIVENLYKTYPENYSDINKVIPFYARKSDAEVMKEKKSKK